MDDPYKCKRESTIRDISLWLVRPRLRDGRAEERDEELLLEVWAWSLRGRTLWWYQGGIAGAGRLHFAVRTWRKLCPIVIRACPRAGTASQESSQSQISEAEAKWIRGKAEEIRRVLIIDGIPRIQRQAEICRAEAGEHRPCVCWGAGVFTVRRRACGRRWRSGPAVQMAGVAVRFATEQVVTGLLVCTQRDIPMQVRVELRRESADIR